MLIVLVIIMTVFILFGMMRASKAKKILRKKTEEAELEKQRMIEEAQWQEERLQRERKARKRLSKAVSIDDETTDEAAKPIEKPQRPHHVSPKLWALANSEVQLQPNQFLKLRSMTKKRETEDDVPFDYSGVYILYNHTKDKYYIGQSDRVLVSITRQFRGNGNRAVYEDYKNKDEWFITTIQYDGTGDKSLDELEEDAIATFDAYDKGYNRKRVDKPTVSVSGEAQVS